MESGARAALLEGGRKLHLQHGPIDLIIAADGDDKQRRLAYTAARDFFADVLSTLVDELSWLREKHIAGAVKRQLDAGAGFAGGRRAQVPEPRLDGRARPVIVVAHVEFRARFGGNDVGGGIGHRHDRRLQPGRLEPIAALVDRGV